MSTSSDQGRVQDLVQALHVYLKISGSESRHGADDFCMENGSHQGSMMF